MRCGSCSDLEGSSIKGPEVCPHRRAAKVRTRATETRIATDGPCTIIGYASPFRVHGSKHKLGHEEVLHHDIGPKPNALIASQDPCGAGNGSRRPERICAVCRATTCRCSWQSSRQQTWEIIDGNSLENACKA